MATGSDDPRSHPAVTVSSWRDENRTVVELEGELDLEGSDRLAAEVHRVLSNPIDRVELDARRLRFIDSSGLVAVLRARSEARNTGVSLHLSDVSPQVAYVIDLVGLTDLLRPE